MLNRKGIVLESMLAIGALVAIIGATVWFAGPSASKTISSLWSGNKNQAKQVHRIKEYRTPFYQNEKGIFVPAAKQDQREEYSENVVATEPPLTFMQKYGGYFLLLGAVVIAFPSVGIWLFTTSRNNLAQLIKGIEEAKKQMPKSSVDILTANLSRKMDDSVKKKVKKIKGQLVAKGDIDTSPPPAVVTPKI